MLNAFNASTAGVQVADDDAHELFRHYHFDGHDRLQQHRRSFARRFLKAHGSRDLERHFVGIYFVIAAVIERYFDIHQFITGQNAAFHRLLHALLNGLEEFARNRAALDLIDELKALAHFVGPDAQLDVTIVPGAAGLADVLTFRLRFLANGFAVCHLRFAHIGFHFVFAHHAVNDDFQMQLAHAADDGLPGIRISRNLEGGIFLRQTGQRDSHLFLVTLRLWLDGDGNHRRGERDRLQQNRRFF